MVKIVGCVVAKELDKALSMMDKAEEFGKVDLFELRVDAFDSEQRKQLEHNLGVFKRYSSKLIITIRKKEEGGFQEIDEEERLDLFKKALDIKPLFIDVEFSSSFAKEIITLARKKGVRIILSNHNLKLTPSYDDLLSLQGEMTELNPDLMKIVTSARNVKDNLSIIRLYENSEHLVAFCMGQKGRLSRVFSLSLSPIAYSSIDMPSAKGQFSIQEINLLKQILGVNDD